MKVEKIFLRIHRSTLFDSNITTKYSCHIYKKQAQQPLFLFAMGVPAFFRWISEKYPKIVQPCIEEEPATFADGTEIPVDATQPNPNGIEFDNLYLDMNGIIHPCTHPEDGSGPLTLEMMFFNIGKHIDRLFRLVRLFVF